jgi:hypothetical protein
VDGALQPTCLRHGMDGTAQALPADWLEVLETKDARCDLYQPVAGAGLWCLLMLLLSLRRLYPLEPHSDALTPIAAKPLFGSLIRGIF